MQAFIFVGLKLQILRSLIGDDVEFSLLLAPDFWLLLLLTWLVVDSDEGFRLKIEREYIN